jgi:hypothetical protein
MVIPLQFWIKVSQGWDHALPVSGGQEQPKYLSLH